MTKESDRQRLAFEIYCATPPPRTYQVVALQVGVSVRTVRHWSKVHDWHKRLAQREQETADTSVPSRLANPKMRENLMKSTQLGFKRVVEGLAAGKDVSPLIASLDRIVRLIAFLEEGLKGPDPAKIDDVEAFLGSVPLEVLQEFRRRAGAGSPP